eukprot:4943069-Pleurochrysis_carterae.AAC.1
MFWVRDELAVERHPAAGQVCARRQEQQSPVLGPYTEGRLFALPRAHAPFAVSEKRTCCIHVGEHASVAAVLHDARRRAVAAADNAHPVVVPFATISLESGDPLIQPKLEVRSSMSLELNPHNFGTASGALA